MVHKKKGNRKKNDFGGELRMTQQVPAERISSRRAIKETVGRKKLSPALRFLRGGFRQRRYRVETWARSKKFLSRERRIRQKKKNGMRERKKKKKQKSELQGRVEGRKFEWGSLGEMAFRNPSPNPQRGEGATLLKSHTHNVGGVS